MAPRPASIWRPSPNFNTADVREISLVVIHATETPGVQSPLGWLTNPASKVSAHYLIDVDGTIYHLVHESDVAWHAGESDWKGKKWCNHFSVGIELVNANDGIMPYPDAQIQACANLVRPITYDYKIFPTEIVGHADIAPGRKTDPGPAFPWSNFRERLAG